MDELEAEDVIFIEEIMVRMPGRKAAEELEDIKIKLIK